MFKYFLGVYICEADNGLGQVSRAQLNVSVLHGPRVKLEKSQVKIKILLEQWHLLLLFNLI